MGDIWALNSVSVRSLLLIFVSSCSGFWFGCCPKSILFILLKNQKFPSAFYTYLYREGKKHPLTGKGKKPQTYKCQNWTVFYLNVLLFSWISHVAFFIVTFPLPPLIYTCVPEVCFLWSVGFFSVCTPTYPLSTPLSFWTFLLAVATKAKIIHLWIVRRVISVI